MARSKVVLTVAQTHALSFGVRRNAVSTDASKEARFRQLFDESYDFIWRTLRRLGVSDGAVDDAAQEVFVVAARRLDAIELGAERSFLFGTARRVASDARRAQKRRPESPADDELADRPDGAPSPEEALGARRAIAMLDRILDEMDDEMREAFVLFELEGLSKAEVAALLGIPEGTAASRLRRGREVFSSAVARMRARLGGAQ